MRFPITCLSSTCNFSANHRKGLTLGIAAATAALERPLILLSYAMVALVYLGCGKNPSDSGGDARRQEPDFKIAFIGDQGSSAEAKAVLTLIKNEGTDLVMHQGDFDYNDDPAAWEAQINEVFGADFPYFASIGNHDEARWGGANGYQQLLKNRLQRLGITWKGDLGVQSTVTYKGIFIVLAGPGTMGSGHEAYIRDQLAADNSIWSICSWHKNMRAMQVGGKSDETGWGVYEAAREGGAIIATAHEHSYSRTHLLSSIVNQTVASSSETLVVTKGKTFVFVSGLGGESIRNQELSGNWWASIYTSTQNANYGALFGTFFVGGKPNAASFYFKDIDGKIVDRFDVVSNVEGSVTAAQTSEDIAAGFVSEK